MEACGALACLAQYTTVPCCLRACVLRERPTPSFASVDRRKENFHGRPGRPRAGVADVHAGGGNFVHPDCVLVIPIGFKSLFPHWATSALHGDVPTTSWVSSSAWVELPQKGGPKFPVSLIRFASTVIFFFIFQNILIGLKLSPFCTEIGTLTCFFLMEHNQTPLTLKQLL